VLIPPHCFGVGHVVISGFRKLGIYIKMIYAVNNAHLSKIIIKNNNNLNHSWWEESQPQ
jgi:hypothetical protein